MKHKDVLINSEDNLYKQVESYIPESLDAVKKAYGFAKEKHAGQLRKSGEPYIVHPLNVAYTLSLYHADKETLCAGILHDILEDTDTTKAEIAYLFNEEIANLVEGVTNFDDMDFDTKEALDMANMRKVILGILKDARIVLIKLCDRLHNMRTLEYQKEKKRVPKAEETLGFYAPLALFLGLHDMKGELEDLSLKYLSPKDYNTVLECQTEIVAETNEMLNEMLYKINSLLGKRNIPNDITIRIKHLYGIYKKIKRGHTLYDIHDLLALRVLVDSVDECYAALGLIHSLYPPVNARFKDFIANPKTNMYRALHTTVFAPDNYLVQARIKTPEMECVNLNGITRFWQNGDFNFRDMQSSLAKDYQFFQVVDEMNQTYADDREFLDHIKTELFDAKVYVFMQNGQVLELPQGATPLDFAYYCSKTLGDHALMVLVNGKSVNLGYELKNNDQVQIITSKTPTVHPEWESFIKTTKARKRFLGK